MLNDSILNLFIFFFAAKSSNQKSKNNNKRQPQPAQPNMRLDKKETRNAEVKAPVSDVTPAPALPTPETKIPPTVVVNCEQPAADDELKTQVFLLLKYFFFF